MFILIVGLSFGTTTTIAELLFQDDFSAYGVASNDLNLHLPPNNGDAHPTENTRQSGILGTWRWTKSGGDNQSQIGNSTTYAGQEGAPIAADYLLLAHNGAATLQLPVNNSLADGEPLTIRMRLGTALPPEASDETWWMAIRLGDAGAYHPVVGSSADFAFLYRINKGIQVFPTGGPYPEYPAMVSRDFALVLTDIAGTGSAFNGNGSQIALYNDGVLVDSFETGQLTEEFLNFTVDRAFASIDSLSIERGIPEDLSPTREWEFNYEPMAADFTLDFGTGAGLVDGEALLRNRADYVAVVDDALRMMPISSTFLSSSALASVSNYEAGEDFEVETEVALTAFPEAQPSRLGLVLLGGPHEPEAAPFDTNEEKGFYAASYFPALSLSDLNAMFPTIESTETFTGVIAITEGFDGRLLAVERWNGRGPGNAIAFEETFEDPATNDIWITGTDSTHEDRDQVESYWEFGAPVSSALAELRDGSTRVAGTVLDDGTPPWADDWLRTPVIDLTDVTSASLSFYESLFLDPNDPERPGVLAQYVSISVVNPDGTHIANVAEYSGDSGNEGAEWRLQEFHLPAEAYGKSVRIEFRLVTDYWTRPDGWMIDDILMNTSGSESGSYALKAEGTHGFGGELELTVTLTDLADAGLYSQSLSTTVLDPLEGNLFGVGGRTQTTDAGAPIVDFDNLTFRRFEPSALVGTTETPTFYYEFGNTVPRVGTERFSLSAEEDWTLQADSLQLTTDQLSGVSAAVTRVREFVPGNAIHVESDILLTSLDVSTGGQIGLVLFGEEDPALFDTADSATYYTLQYRLAEGKIALREGTSGMILHETPFPAPVEGTTYHFEFTGNFSEGGDLDFNASVSDGAGGAGALTGTLPAPFEGRRLFGVLAAQGGGDTWDVQGFGGYTSPAEDSPYRFFRWTVQGTRGDSSYQFSELSFFFEGEDILETRRAADPEDLPRVTGPNMGHATENPSSLVDGDTATKLFGTTDWSIPVVFDLREPTRIDGYMMWTANDFAGRDPTAWTLEGSLDGFTWKILDVRAGVTAPEERFTRYLEAGEFSLSTGAILENFEVEGVSDGVYLTRNGESVNLSWETFFATSVRIEPDVGQVASSGTLEIVAPADANTAYTLTAVGLDGVEQTATVNVYSRAGQTQSYRYVRFDIADATAMRDPNINYLQMAEFDFFLNGTHVEPVSVANPNGKIDYDNEQVGNLLDGDSGTKWADGNRLHVNDSHLVFDFGEVVQIDGYRFTTGNDLPSRDPLRWRLWGRNLETETWTLIEDAPFDYAVTTERLTPTQIFPFPENLPVPGVVHQFAIIGAGGAAFEARQALVVEDGTNIELSWETSGATNVSIAPGPGAVDVTGTVGLMPPQSTSTIYTLTAPGDAGTDVAQIWVRSVPVDHFEEVRYVRFDIPDATALRSPTINYVQIAEFDFFRNGSHVEPVGVENPNGDITYANEAPTNLLDGGVNTKWADANLLHIDDSHLVFDFGEVVEIDAYGFTTGNDLPERDPVRWRMYGRNTDEEEWRLIEHIDFNYSVPIDRLTAMDPISLPGAALQVPTAQPYSDWLDEHFLGADRTNPAISGPLADPAGDGVSNLLKYAFGLDPLTPVSSNELPQAEVIVEEGLRRLRLTYVERIGTTDVVYTPQKSFTLAEWNSEGVVEVAPRVALEGGEFELVTVELLLNAESRAFLRIQVVGGGQNP